MKYFARRLHVNGSYTGFGKVWKGSAEKAVSAIEADALRATGIFHVREEVEETPAPEAKATK